MTMYYRRRRRRRRVQNYLFPLVLLLVVFVGFYFVVKGFGYLFSLGNDESYVELYVEQGQAQVQAFGTDQPLNQLIPGQPVFAGDTIKTSSTTRAVLVFFGNTQLRLAPNSEVILESVEGDDREENVKVILNQGEVWADIIDTDLAKKYEYIVSTNNLNVKAVGTKFSVKAKVPEFVRVIEGSVLVDVKTIEGGTNRVLESEIPVSIAQEFSLTAEALQAFINRDTPKVLGAISEEFERSNWYDWNATLDLNPSLVLSFDGNSPIQVAGNNFDDEVLDDDTELEDEDNLDDDLEDEVDPDAFPVPVITSPDNEEILSDRVIAIEGTTSPDTVQIEVTSFEDDEPNLYILQRYDAGSENWRYIATFDGGNLVEGVNKYEVRAIDAEGNKSEPALIEVTLELDVEEIGGGVSITTTPAETDDSN